MKRALFLLLLLLAASLMLPNCGSSSKSGTTTTSSGLTHRAFFTENVSAGTITAGVYIVNAQTDVRPSVAPISAGNTPGMMVLTPNRTQTLVFSPEEDQFTVITNASETAANHITVPGFTESFVVSPDSTTAYAAVPTAAVVGQSPGAVEVISLSSVTFTGEVAIPSVRYLSIDNAGNRILAFSDNSDSVAVITPLNIGTNTGAVTYVGGFDRPVAAFFSSDDTTAYVVNCGAECGGTQASVQTVDLTTNIAGKAVPVPAASAAMLNGTTMYLAGTPVSASPCTGQTTAATTCGLLTIFDLSSMTATKSGIAITDGYHDHLALGANGRLFIGARTCAEITAASPGAEVRGCLSIYNTQTGAVVIPLANGDVTGMQPIPNRTVVYVVQNGALAIYDTATDALEHNPNNPNNPGQIFNLIGQFVDVKMVDP